MNGFIQFIPTLLFIYAIVCMLRVTFYEAKSGASKKTKDEEMTDFYTLRMLRCDFHGQMSIVLASIISFFLEDDIWWIFIGVIFCVFALNTHIKIKQFL